MGITKVKKRMHIVQRDTVYDFDPPDNDNAGYTAKINRVKFENTPSIPTMAQDIEMID